MFVGLFLTDTYNSCRTWFCNYGRNSAVPLLQLSSSAAPCCTQNTTGGGWSTTEHAAKLWWSLSTTYMQPMEEQHYNCSLHWERINPQGIYKNRHTRKASGSFSFDLLATDGETQLNFLKPAGLRGCHLSVFDTLRLSPEIGGNQGEICCSSNHS